MQHSTLPQAHQELFAAPAGKLSVPSLLDFHPSLPEDPVDDPEKDLTAPKMTSREVHKQLGHCREGTTVTINTAYQGVVRAENAFEPEDIPSDELPDTYAFKAHTVLLFNDVEPAFIWLVHTGYSTGNTYYVKPDGTTVRVQHLAFDNEDNLEDEIDEERYEVLKARIGQTVLAHNRSVVGPVEITGATDGVIEYQLLTGNATQKVSESSSVSWFLPETGSHPEQYLHGAAEDNWFVGEEGPTASVVDAIDVFDRDQLDALRTVVSLPEREYKVSTDGLYTNEDGAIVVTSTDLAGVAFPHADPIELSHTDLSFEDRDALSSLDRPITDIVGIGTATACELSGIQRRKTRSRSKILKKHKEADPDVLTVEEVDEPHPELEAAYENFDPPERNEKEILSLREFLDEGLNLTDISRRYHNAAVATIRKTIEPSRYSRKEQLLRLHAGATLGRLYDDTPEKIGTLANIFLSSFEMDDVSSVVAWNSHEDESTPVFTDAETAYVLTEDPNFENMDVGGFKYSASYDGARPVDVVDSSGEYLSFISANLENFPSCPRPDAIKPAATSLYTESSAGNVAQHIAEYVAALFGIDPTDNEYVKYNVRVDEDGSVYMNHPDSDVDLTFAILHAEF